MTQTLSPDDTGEIKTDPSMTTQNLAPYAAGLPPAMRRPGATGESRMVLRPPTNVQRLIERASDEPVVFLGEHTPNYVGRHRRRTLWQRLTGGAR